MEIEDGINEFDKKLISLLLPVVRRASMIKPDNPDKEQLQRIKDMAKKALPKWSFAEKATL